MARQLQHHPQPGSEEPLIALFLEEDGRKVVRYFASDEEADAAVSPGATERALQLAGAWSDLEWDEVRTGLERIRRESSASPPLSL